jgi:hypothetical protein
MAFAIISQVRDAVPLPIGLDAGVVSRRRRCLLQTDIGQIRILQADKVFELSVSCGSGESYLRGCISFVPRPTHTSHLALNPRALAESAAKCAHFDVGGDGAGAGAMTGGGAAGATGAGAITGACITGAGATGACITGAGATGA